MPLAMQNGASKLTPGPEGSWPLRFDRLVQPVLDKHCVECHGVDAGDTKTASFDLTTPFAYQNLIAFAEKDLEKLAFEKDRSFVGECPARRSKLLALLAEDANHSDIALDENSFERLVTWMDTYAHRQGSFSPEQEKQLAALKQRYRHLLEE